MGFDPTRRLLIYAQGAFGRGRSKTAEGVLRYGRYPVVGVVDATHAGKTAQEVVGCGGPVPICESLEAARPLKPQALLIGIAPPGGDLPHAWRPDLVQALKSGMDIVSGLHDFLGDDPELARVARRHRRLIWDVRKPAQGHPIANARAAQVASQVVLTVGTDAAIGKMTVCLEMLEPLRRSGRRAQFLATGQTGIMISGFGVPLDRVIGDFMAGMMEDLVLEHAPDHDLLLVEGQGALLHPGYSGVTLSLIHGTAPSQMILCHDVRRSNLRDTPVKCPSLAEVIALHEAIARPIRPAKVIGLSVTTASLDDDAARRYLSQTSDALGLPACDPLRTGVEPLVKAVNAAFLPPA